MSFRKQIMRIHFVGGELNETRFQAAALYDSCELANVARGRASARAHDQCRAQAETQVLDDLFDGRSPHGYLPAPPR